MLRKRLRLIAASLLLASAGMAVDAGAAWAQRGNDRGHDRGRDDHRGGDRNRGSDWNRGGDRGRNDWNRGNDNRRNDWNNNRGRDDHRHRDNDIRFGLGIFLGQPSYYAPPPSYSYNPYPYGYYQSGYSWRPYECRTEIRYDYWRGRRADIEVRVCADRYGSPYRVAGYDRFVRYR